MQDIAVIVLFVLLLLFVKMNIIEIFNIHIVPHHILNSIDMKQDEFIKAINKSVYRGTLFGLLMASLMNQEIRLLLFSLIVSFFIFKDYIKLFTFRRIRKKNVRYQFPIWLRQMQVLMQRNTVVNALKASIAQSPYIIRKDLTKLVDEVYHNGQNYQYYEWFLSTLNMVEISRAMKLLYRYQVIGSDDSQQQFERMIAMTSKWLRKERTDSQKGQIAVYQWWALVPLITVTFIFMIFMFLIMTQLLERR